MRFKIFQSFTSSVELVQWKDGTLTYERVYITGRITGYICIDGETKLQVIHDGYWKCKGDWKTQ